MAPRAPGAYLESESNSVDEPTSEINQQPATHTHEEPTIPLLDFVRKSYEAHRVGDSGFVDVIKPPPARKLFENHELGPSCIATTQTMTCTRDDAPSTGDKQGEKSKTTTLAATEKTQLDLVGDAPSETKQLEPVTTLAVAAETVSKTSHTTESEGLFGPSLISPTVAASLPESYSIRALRKSDYNRGFLDCLRVLTTVGDITEAEWNGRYEWMETTGKGGYYLLVIDDGSRIVGTGALIVERKFIHHLGLVGHIEDIAVAKDQQGKKLGLKIIQALDYIAAAVGCYKSILDCSEANEGFYVKCGFKRAGLEMAHYYETS